MFSGNCTTKLRNIVGGYCGLTEYCYKTYENESESLIKLINDEGNGAIDENYIGFDINRDGYIDQKDVKQLQLCDGKVETW